MKAKIAFLLGIISLIASLINFLPSSVNIWRISLGTYEQVMVYFKIFIPLSMIGIIFGIIGSKPNQKKFSIIGIIFSAISLVILLGLLFIVFGIARM